MKNSIENANQITLNLIQKELHASVSKPDFLKMIFPGSLRNGDSNALLDFIFDSDSSYQASRTSFFNGNIYKKGATYSRAHQSELNFIAKQINTASVFEEMADLLSNNFNISMQHQIFSLLSLDDKLYPDKFRNALAAYQSTNEPHKLLALMILWSIYGEWITLLSLGFHSVQIQKEQLHSDSTLDYFNYMLAQVDHVKSIDMAFQSGAMWLTNAARTNRLIEFIRHDVQINLIIAEYDPIERVSQNTFSSGCILSAIHTMWHVFALKYPTHVKIRICPLPLMHNFFCFHMEDPSKNIMRTKSYVYHNTYVEKNPTHFYDISSEFYTLFENEFHYLWSISKDISAFIKDTRESHSKQ